MKPDLLLKQMEVGPMENFTYLVGDRGAKEALVVDPAWDVPAILEAAGEEGLRIKGALVTHTHFDHVNGLEELLKATDGIAYVHKHEAVLLGGMKSQIKTTEEGSRLRIGNVSIDFLHTPGHTAGSQCFLVEGKNLISGDTLFINACGRCDLPGSSPEEMYRSLRRLCELDDAVVVYPGHHYDEALSSTIGSEKRTNPYLQCPTLDDFLKLRMG